MQGEKNAIYRLGGESSFHMQSGIQARKIPVVIVTPRLLKQKWSSDSLCHKKQLPCCGMTRKEKKESRNLRHSSLLLNPGAYQQNGRNQFFQLVVKNNFSGCCDAMVWVLVFGLTPRDLQLHHTVELSTNKVNKRHGVAKANFSSFRDSDIYRES